MGNRPRGAEGPGTSPPTQRSWDLHRGVRTCSDRFCCDTVGVRDKDLSRMERNQKPSMWGGCGQQTRSRPGCRDFPVVPVKRSTMNDEKAEDARQDRSGRRHDPSL